MSKDKMSEHIFVPNGAYYVNYPSNIFATHAVLIIGEYPQMFPSFSWRMTHLDQLRVSKNT